MTRFPIFLAICLFVPSVFANELTTPGALWASFQANPDAFREKHSGTKINVSGVVADTHISIYLTPVVSLVDKVGEESKVICVLPNRSDASKLSNYKKGERVKMTGNFYAAREEKIVIKQCQAEGK